MTEKIIPDGYKLVAVKGLDELVYWLERCKDKGHLENCADLIEPFEAFEYRNISEEAVISAHEAKAAPAEPFGYFRAEPFGWTDCAETDEGAIALYERPAAPAVPQGEPVWIVNDQGELGVKVNGRFFFLYKGDNIEYGTVSDVQGGVCYHGDGTPMKYRIVGKREFGETCCPASWWEAGKRQDRYTVDLVYTPGLSFGQPEDCEWKPLPATSPHATPAAPSQEQVMLTDFDAIPDEVIDTAQDKSGMYRVELMRAWGAIIAALREKESGK